MTEALSKNITVGDSYKLIVEKPATVKSDQLIDEALKIMIEDTKTTSVYVLDDKDRLAGVIRWNTVAQYLFPYSTQEGSSYNSITESLNVLDAVKAGDIMNNEPFYVRKETTVPQTIKIMASEKINELPVVSPDMHVIGVIHILEITKAYLDQQENNGTGQNK